MNSRWKRTSQYRLRLAAEVSSLMRWSQSTAIYAAGAHHAAAVILCFMGLRRAHIESPQHIVAMASQGCLLEMCRQQYGRLQQRWSALLSRSRASEGHCRGITPRA